jgi:putative DNA primase/helicase
MNSYVVTLLSFTSVLRNELAGILNWALDGLREWRVKGLGDLPSAMKSATEEYRRDNDSIGQWIEERTVQNPVGKIRAGEGYGDYSKWIQERGERAFSQKNWGRSLIERSSFSKGRDSEGYYYLGANLRLD